MIRVIAGAATHVGRVREANEDSFLCANGLFFVADGMGGHSAGEVASDIAVTTLREVLSEAGNIVLASDDVAAAVRHANTAIYSESVLDSSKAGMGTTLTGLAVSNPFDHKAVVANVGDSRTYLWRHGELRQITKDHSHVQSLVDRGAITRAEARVHHQRNIVLRAMGIDSYVDVDTFEVDIEDGDRFIICSDGLVDEADDNEIEAQVRSSIGPQDLADRLVTLANDNGGRDNVTVLVVDFVLTTATDSTPIVTEIPPIAATIMDPPARNRTSMWFSVAAWVMWLAAAGITVAVAVSAIASK